MIIPRTEDHIKAAVEEELRGDIFLVFVEVFPVRNDHATVQQLQRTAGILIVAVGNRLYR